MTTAPELDIDILCSEAIADPYTYFARLRETAPVVWDARYRSWIVTRHDLITTALKDARFSSNRIAPFIDSKLADPDTDPGIRQAFDILRNWLVFQDAPNHPRIRGLVRQAFTPKAVARMEDSVRAISLELVAALPASGEFDLDKAFAYPLPALVIAEMLGVPAAERDRFKGWSENIAPIVSGGLDDPDRYTRASLAMAELIEFFTDLLNHFAEHPADNLLTALVQARDEGDALTQIEVIATCTLLLFAGHETTSNLITSSMLALLQNPSELEKLRAGDVTIRNAVEELLRWDGPGKAVTRVLAEDVELGGELLREGQRVFFVLAAANRDPAVFDDPDMLKLDRDTSRHAAFGHGVHFCLGGALARLELWVALPILLEALPSVRLADRELVWQQVFLTRGLQALWLQR